jgi:hypothetical protein
MVPVLVVEIVPVRVVEIVPVRVVEIVPFFEKAVNGNANVNKTVASTNFEVLMIFSWLHSIRGHGRLTAPAKPWLADLNLTDYVFKGCASYPFVGNYDNC